MRGKRVGLRGDRRLVKGAGMRGVGSWRWEKRYEEWKSEGRGGV